jgi:hypothetical protein
MCRLEPTARLQQASQDRARQAKGRICDNVVRPSRESEVGGIGTNDDDGIAERGAQPGDSPRMPLNRDDATFRLE